MLGDGAVRIDGEPVNDDDVRPVSQWWGATLQVGKRNWVRVVEPVAPVEHA
jgi:hypothetical protein